MPFTAKEIEGELRANGGDFFDAEARLQQRLADAARTEARLNPPASDTVAEPWATEPSADAIRQRMRERSESYEDARGALREEMAADSARLQNISSEVSKEITASLRKATAAKERAEWLLAEHQAQLDSIKGAIEALGAVRKRIQTVRALSLDDAATKKLAETALNYFVAKQGRGSPQSESGWSVTIQDLAFRGALQPHIAGFLEPLLVQEKELASSIVTQAKIAKVDLRRLFAAMQGERRKRGIVTPFDCDLAGLV